MTHDELLERISQYWNGIPYLSQALEAVAELHKPQEITLPNGEWGANCIECDCWSYPCPTIKAIEKVLE